MVSGPADSVIVLYHGTVFDENGQRLLGATIKVKGRKNVSRTTPEGNFFIEGPARATLIISYVGYINKEIGVTAADKNSILKITMAPNSKQLGEVNIVSTGYQDKSKESATGAFELVTKEQLQHSNDPNILKRLDGITTSLDFRTNSITNPTNSSAGSFGTSPLANLTIRGKNTLNVFNTPDNTSGQPLVVIDGIASAYSVDQVSPDDVESITILKDAASASIWGSRAANGVIVIKTKRGSYSRPTRVSFNTNIDVTEKMDLFYRKLMSTSDYVDAQMFAYNNLFKGTATLPAFSATQARAVVSPVAEIMNQMKTGAITAAQGKVQLDALRGNDIRNDMEKYLIRPAVSQNYSLAIDGGSKQVAYRLSGSYNNNLNNTKYSSSDRFNLNYSTSFKLFKKIEFTSVLTYILAHTNSPSQQNNIDVSTRSAPYYMYTRLADDQGNPLAIPYTYRPGFIDLLNAKYGSKILDYTFKPLDNLKNGGYMKNKNQTMAAILNASYSISPVFSANLSYNYTRGLSERVRYNSPDSWYMRDLINTFTDPVTLVRNIPLGGYYNPTNSKTSNQTLRGMFTANKNWNDVHQLTAIAGVDISKSTSNTMVDQFFGYDPNTLSTNNVLNYIVQTNKLFTAPDGSSRAAIPRITNPGFSFINSRTLSEFANADYSYKKRYTLSASIRKDGSSEFGPGTNKTGTPYYSFGGAWNINKESFYKSSLIPFLKLRMTYGYNGNVNPAITAQPTLLNSPTSPIDPYTGLPYTFIADGATNNKLRPERTGVWNTGLDFGFKGGRISGSLDYYIKKTTDLITNGPLDPSTGYSTLYYNTANLRGQGIDFSLNTKNLQLGRFSWVSAFLFSYNRVKVTKLFVDGAETVSQVIQGDSGGYYNVGADLTRVFAIKWAGLDPATGDPRGYVNGQPVRISNDAAGVTAINNIFNQPRSEAHFFGSAVPVYFGGFRNTFSYGALTVSANIQYKLGYFLRRPATAVVNYRNLYNTGEPAAAEYANRWQKPGDELTTNVPSAVFTTSTYRDTFYQFADINVMKGDHIRLQEINLSYGINNKPNWFVKNPRIYLNVSNLGIIWKANKFGIDPSVLDYPHPRSYSFGFSANF
ncbi:SusC/RagA family TonB-linked outer membrane protein [Pedobacter lusitanus]|nr:SusC/RagA family TonB-linked outer membrane protein [Pedobacter lusitanus]